MLPLWIIVFLMPGASAALWHAVPWLSILVLLYGLFCLALRLGAWLLDDTWMVERDRRRQVALAAERADALRFPTSRRALRQHLPQRRIERCQRLGRQARAPF